MLAFGWKVEPLGFKLELSLLVQPEWINEIVG